MLVVILTGGIDLSVGSIVALTGIVTAGLTDSLSLPVAVVIGLLVGLSAGGLNGFLVAKLKLPAFIATLATLSALRGLTYVYSEIPQTPNNPAFRSFLGGGYIGPVPIAVILMLIIYPLVWFFINRTTSGRAIFAIGGNEEAVRLAGINVGRHIAWAYIISGLCSGIAGILLASRLGIAQPSVGVGYELAAIAAVVIGGGILGGGGGSVFGTFAGVLILGLINNLLNLFNVQSYYQQILSGGIIVFAVLARQKE
jgi:ribose/xylose/arabinose/galactoside ABC-type transport system permease subunit